MDIRPTTDQTNQTDQKKSKLSSNKSSQINQINQPTVSSRDVIDSKTELNSKKKPTRQFLFMKSSSIDQPIDKDHQSIEKNHQPIERDHQIPKVPYLLPRKLNNQVNKMTKLFESKFNEELYNVPNRRYETNSRNQIASSFTPKKSSTQPNFMNYKLNEPLDKKKVIIILILELDQN